MYVTVEMSLHWKYRVRHLMLYRMLDSEGEHCHVWEREVNVCSEYAWFYWIIIQGLIQVCKIS